MIEKLPAGYSITSRKNDNRWRDDPQWDGSDKWSVTLRNPEGKTLSTQFWKGPGHNGAKPTFDEVAESLISDGQAYESTGDVESLASEYGYVYDTRKEFQRIEKIFNQCKSISVRIREFFGNDYELAAYGEYPED